MRNCASAACSPATSPPRRPTAASARRSRPSAPSTPPARSAGTRSIVGPGPGIIGSGTEYGHGGVAAVESAHAALSLKLPTLVSPRLSCSDPRERHLHLSHHTYTLLELLLAPVEVAVPDGRDRWPAEARGCLESAAAEGGHTLAAAPVDLDAYAAAGLPTTTMGRPIAEDPLFFAAPLAAGAC